MKTAPFGTWQSPIRASDLARSAIALGYPQSHAGQLHWVESRPADGGRNVVMAWSARGEMQELTPAGFNVRSRVHEYGGSPYVQGHGALYFCNFSDQRLYAQRPGAQPIALTPEGYRYADLVLDRTGRHLYGVREDHTGPGEPRNAIVVLDTTTGGAGTVLYGDSDFVATPRISPDGARIAWIAWNHPDMPWDATTLYVADLAPAGLSNITAIAGGPGESVQEPAWDLDGTLYFVSDRSNWWNLYRHTRAGSEVVLAMEAEFTAPLWVLGYSSYALSGDGRAVVRYSAAAEDRLGVLDLHTGKLTTLDLPYVSVSGVQLLDANTAAVVAASQFEEPAVVTIDLRTAAHRTVRAPSTVKLDRSYISTARPIEFPTTGALTAHAFYYPPVNPDYAGPSGERPPLIVKVHGGPTSHSKSDLALAVQFWTTRGFAFLDVNHGGSSGFGRAYRGRLDGNWGIVDVNDVVAAVRYLIERGLVDGNRAAIRGGSAGGFTVLSALAFHDVFKAGANYYGVSDLIALAHDTHKFESRYLDRLVAPLPQGRDIYELRAPIRHLDGFKAALITFQGSEDKVVPPEQSRAIVAALESRGVPVEYIEFAGEQHGFRKAESIVRSLEAELAFYGRVFGFIPAENSAGG